MLNDSNTVTTDQVEISYINTSPTVSNLRKWFSKILTLYICYYYYYYLVIQSSDINRYHTDYKSR